MRSLQAVRKPESSRVCWLCSALTASSSRVGVLVVLAALKLQAALDILIIVLYDRTVARYFGFNKAQYSSRSYFLISSISSVTYLPSR